MNRHSELAKSLADSHVLVAGLGVSGQAVVDVLTELPNGRHPASVSSLDAQAEGASYSSSSQVPWDSIDLVIASPGWPPHHEALTAAADHAVPVWSEIELAWQLRVNNEHTNKPAPWLAVTGTNGKTTTVELLATILHADGLRVATVGNVGAPVIRQIQNPTIDVFVLELSSFQLHFTYSMEPLASAILNIAEDHVDWHGSFDQYASDKARIFTHTHRACVYSEGDDRVVRLLHEADVHPGARAISVSAESPTPSSLGIVDGVLCDRAFTEPLTGPQRYRHAAELAQLSDLAHLAGPDGVVGSHTITNTLFAAALARAYGVAPRAVRDGVKSFQPGRHRIEHVATVAKNDAPQSGVTFINDSKATNAHAARASLLSLPLSSTVWIVGGVTKGANLDSLIAEIGPQLRSAVVIGVEHQEIVRAFARHAPHIPVHVASADDTGGVMRHAVNTAWKAAEPGDVVILAPACASMDQFDSYAHRGDEFVRWVTELIPPGQQRKE